MFVRVVCPRTSHVPSPSLGESSFLLYIGPTYDLVCPSVLLSDPERTRLHPHSGAISCDRDSSWTIVRV